MLKDLSKNKPFLVLGGVVLAIAIFGGTYYFAGSKAEKKQAEVTPTMSPKASPTTQPTLTEAPTLTIAPKATITPSATPTLTPTPTVKPTPTVTPKPTAVKIQYVPKNNPAY